MNRIECLFCPNEVPGITHESQSVWRTLNINHWRNCWGASRQTKGPANAYRTRKTMNYRASHTHTHTNMNSCCAGNFCWSSDAKHIAIRKQQSKNSGNYLLHILPSHALFLILNVGVTKKRRRFWYFHTNANANDAMNKFTLSVFDCSTAQKY